MYVASDALFNISDVRFLSSEWESIKGCIDRGSNKKKDVHIYVDQKDVILYHIT